MPRQKISITVDSALLREVDGIIDNVTVRNRSQAIEHLVRASLGESKTAVLLSGGPVEKIRIGEAYRATALVSGKPVCVHAVEKLRSEGFSKIIVVARGPVLTAMFSILKDGRDLGVSVVYVEERNCHGTADSLRLVRGQVKGAFLVVYGDLMFSNVRIAELWKEHMRDRKEATLLLTTSLAPSTKGTAKIEGSTILEFMQKPRQSQQYIVFSPIFACEDSMLSVPGSSLEKDVFPTLAGQRLLKGYLSSEKECHVHTADDAAGYAKKA